jgi:hypothetical protein
MIVFGKWMAAAQPFQGQPAALQGSVFGDCFISIGRAGRGVPAFGRKSGRNVLLIEPDQKKKYFFHTITL